MADNDERARAGHPGGLSVQDNTQAPPPGADPPVRPGPRESSGLAGEAPRGPEPASHKGSARLGGPRFIRAYWVTLVVLFSYSWARLVGGFRSSVAAEEHLRRLHVRNARRIRRTIVRLQGVFIKVGQTFSTLTNFLPEDFRRELETLQDAVPARPYAAIRDRIRAEFVREHEEVFATFEPEPVAAASISQVHFATTHAGERVAVKVQYPDIDAMVREDLRTFRTILRLVSWFYPTQGFGLIHKEVSEMLLAELDFEAEARHMDVIRATLAKHPEDRVQIPLVFPEHCTRRVLTTQFVDGVKVSNTQRLDELGIDRRDVARRIVSVYCRQIFEDGFYHADPHPGNLLVGADGTLTLLDFGAVAAVSPAMRLGIAHFLQGVLNQDTVKIASALKEMGFIAQTAEPDVFDRVVAYFHERFRESVTLESLNLSDIRIDPERGMEHLLALREMNIGLGELSSAFRIPRQWILLERTVLLLTGLCTHLDASIRPMELLRPYLRDFVLGEDPDWSAFAIETGKDALIRAMGLPAELSKFLARANTGRMEVRVHGLEGMAHELLSVGRQVVLALIGVSAAAIGAYLEVNERPVLAERAFLVAWVAAVLVGGSMLRQGRRRR